MWSSYTLRKIKSALDEYRHRRVPKVQVLGERCSGTNFTEALLLENLPVHEGHSFGWKHGFPAFLAAAPDTVYVVVYREVFGWLRSMYDKPWHAVPVVAALTFSEFIRAEWHSTVDERFQLAADDPANHQILQQDRHPITGQPPRNLLELRKWKAEALLGLSARGIKVVHWPHDRIVADPVGVVRDVARLHNLEAPDEVRVPEGHFGWEWNRFAATPERRPTEISPEDRAFILANLDYDLEEKLGFRYSEHVERSA